MDNLQKVIHNTYDGYDYYILSGETINNLLPIAFVILKEGDIKQLSIEYFPQTVSEDKLVVEVKKKIDNMKKEKSLPHLYFELEQLIVNKNYQITKGEDQNE